MRGADTPRQGSAPLKRLMRVNSKCGLTPTTPTCVLHVAHCRPAFDGVQLINLKFIFDGPNNEDEDEEDWPGAGGRLHASG